MNPVSFLPAVFALFIALITTKLIVKFSKTTLAPVKHLSIDGLRGYLAFFVFLHHSSIWYFYMRSNIWVAPPSHLYTHFGNTGVAMFFMITGFLFFSKLIEAKGKSMDWLKFYVARVMRLLPLYLVAILALVIIVFILKDFSLNDSISILIKKIIIWASFTIMGTPDINGVANTSGIMAGVAWSLIYEWLFYFSLPLFALLLFRVKSPVVIFVGACLAIIFIIKFNALQKSNILCFSGGIAAAFLIRIEKFRELASGKPASIIVLLCLITSVVFFSNPYSLIPMFLISVAFVSIACGNSLFGLLANLVSRTLGQMAYSIYLLHGILLFVTFNFIVGIGVAKNLSAINYWLLIGCCVPPLVLICYGAHIYIEIPFMNASQKITDTLKKFLRINLRNA